MTNARIKKLISIGKHESILFAFTTYFPLIFGALLHLTGSYLVLNSAEMYDLYFDFLNRWIKQVALWVTHQIFDCTDLLLLESLQYANSLWKFASMFAFAWIFRGAFCFFAIRKMRLRYIRIVRLLCWLTFITTGSIFVYLKNEFLKFLCGLFILKSLFWKVASTKHRKILLVQLHNITQPSIDNFCNFVFHHHTCYRDILSQSLHRK